MAEMLQYIIGNFFRHFFFASQVPKGSLRGYTHATIRNILQSKDGVPDGIGLTLSLLETLFFHKVT